MFRKLSSNKDLLSSRIHFLVLAASYLFGIVLLTIIAVSFMHSYAIFVILSFPQSTVWIILVLLLMIYFSRRKIENYPFYWSCGLLIAACTLFFLQDISQRYDPFYSKLAYVMFLLIFISYWHFINKILAQKAVSKELNGSDKS
jgi:hypothetical protein